MVAQGITRARLPARNDIICTLADPATPALAQRRSQNTRSAAALDLWCERLRGAVVAIGNAPTALFHLLELLDAGAPSPGRHHRPARRLRRRHAESKDALWADQRVPCHACSCRAAAAAAPWPLPPSTRSPATPNEPAPSTAVGVGPGDPELLTLKAARILAAAPAYAYLRQARPAQPRPHGIAAAHLHPDAEALRFDYPFTTEIPVTNPALRRRHGRVLPGRLRHHRRQIGLRLPPWPCSAKAIPFFYGSAMYVFDHLSRRYRHEVIPGITGMSGAWARARLPMTHGDDVLTGAARHALDGADLTLRPARHPMPPSS